MAARRCCAAAIGCCAIWRVFTAATDGWPRPNARSERWAWSLASAAPARVRIYLDRPVSNSGRLRELLRTVATSHGWPWDVLLADNPDKEILACAGWLTASGDAAVLDRCGGWLPLTDLVIAAAAPAAWIVDLAKRRRELEANAVQMRCPLFLVPSPRPRGEG